MRQLAIFAIIMLWGSCFAFSEMVSRDIFSPVERHTHSSSIIETENGWFLACWYEGSGERKANDVSIKGASLKSHSQTHWSNAFSLTDTPDLPDCNPFFFYDDQKRIWLYWIVPIGNRWENSLLFFKRASGLKENGEPLWNWQGNIILKPGHDFLESMVAGFNELRMDENMWSEYSKQLINAANDPSKRQMGWMTRNHPLQLSKNHWIVPMYSDGFNVSLMAITYDGGETWKSSKPIVGLGPIQPTLASRSANEVVAFMRDSGPNPGRVMVSYSKDAGNSWSLAQDTEIPNPGSSVAVLHSNNGHWLLAGNFNEKDRSSLGILGSSDYGNNWNYRLEIVSDLSDDQKASYSYPSIIEDAQGQFHMTFSVAANGKETIRHIAIERDVIFNKENQFAGWKTLPNVNER